MKASIKGDISHFSLVLSKDVWSTVYFSVSKALIFLSNSARLGERKMATNNVFLSLVFRLR